MIEKQLKIQTKNFAEEDQKFMAAQIEALKAQEFTGIFDFSDQLYHSGVGISNSMLSDFAKRPNFFHWKHIQKNGLETTEAMDIGDMVHKAILEPHLVHECYMSESEIIEDILREKPETKKPRATKAYKETVEMWESKGRKVLAEEHFEMMRTFVDKVYKHPKAKNILSNGRPEQCIYARDPETGLLLRGKADFLLSDGIIVDIKTTSNAAPEEFSKSIWNYRYHVQAAFYLHLCKLAFGAHFKNFIWICLDKQKPYDVAIYTPDEGTLDFGQKMFEKNLRELAHCFDKDKWPGFPNSIQSIALPAWAWNKAEDLI